MHILDAALVIPLVIFAGDPTEEEITSSACSECHMQIYDQWKTSMHSRSTPFGDPIHGAMYRKLIGDPTAVGVLKNGKYPVCMTCHVPAAAMDGSTKLDAKASYKDGVGCLACHGMERYNGVVHPDGNLRLGVKAYTMSRTLQGLSGRTYSQEAADDDPLLTFHPFPMKGNSLLKKADACMGCHDQRPNAHGVPLCATGDEVAVAGSTVSCQSCHMPLVKCDTDLEPYEKEFITDHSLMGGHSEAMVSRAMAMSLRTQRMDDMIMVSVTLENLLPHKFPTGAPFRNVVIQVTAFDESGKKLWRNFEENPFKEDPKSALFYKLGDEEGEPAEPPVARQVLGDSRLLPGEIRTLIYDIPLEGVKLIRAEALYRLLTPPMVNKLNDVLTPDLIAPRRAASAEMHMN